MRCFVALWPPEQLAATLDEAAAALQQQAPRARRIAPDDLHLTLAFIGEASTPQMNAIVEALRELPVEPFDWRIDRVGSFRSARVAWAGGPPDRRLDALAGRVRRKLDVLQIPYDAKPFVGHVTLLRKLDAAMRSQPIAPLAWPVDRPLLAVSQPAQGQEPRYRRMK